MSWRMNPLQTKTNINTDMAYVDCDWKTRYLYLLKETRTLSKYHSLTKTTFTQ